MAKSRHLKNNDFAITNTVRHLTEVFTLVAASSFFVCKESLRFSKWELTKERAVGLPTESIRSFSIVPLSQQRTLEQHLYIESSDCN